MSIYDDLANSGYLNQEDLKAQFQQNAFPLEQSMDAMNNYREFNQYEMGNSGIQNDNDFTDNKFKYGASSQFNPNYKKTFIPENDPFGIPSDMKSPIAMASDNSQIGMKQNLFGQKNYSDDPDGFLKDSTTGLPYNQPRRGLQLEDDDIIQMQHLATNHQELRTGRFATHSTMDEQTHVIHQHPLPNQIFNDDLGRFKNQNDQIQEILKQLQTPFNDMMTPHQFQNPQPSYQQPQHHYQRSQSEHLNYYGYQQVQQPQTQQVPNYPNFHKLNSENSILEIAKMQNSGNGSDNITNNNSMLDQKDQLSNYKNLDNISRDYPHISKPSFPQRDHFDFEVNQDFFKMPSNVNTVGASLISYQKFIPPYPSIPENNMKKNVSAYEQENIDQNIFQMPRVVPNQFEQSLMNEQQFVKIPQYPTYQQQPQVIHQQQQPHLYHRAMSDIEIKKKELMNKFDDIPIKDLNKAEGYQQPRLDNENEDADADDSNLSLLEKIEHPKWKVRMNAYKEISSLFYNEYSRECIKNKGAQSQDTEEDQNLVRPFDQYGPVLHKIICDTNLVAQYEGLNALFTYIKFAPDIKSVIFQVHSILLEKIQHNKANFKELTMKILTGIMKKDKSQSLLPELLKRFKNKNTKIAIFSSEVVEEGLRQSLLNDESTLRQIFKNCQENLSHPNKELRETTIEIIRSIYRNCEDDLNVFTKNLKNLRPVQLKDIKDLLADEEKLQTSVQLFKNYSMPAQTHTEGFSPKKTSGKDLIEQEDLEPVKETMESDLNLLVPENFNEIPYITQISIKKKGMESFNAELEKLIQRKQYCQVQNKDYTQIFNVVTHMLEDSNALVFMEAIKTVEYLCIILGRNIKPQKIRQFISLLADKYKETKTAPVSAVSKALSTIIKKQNLPITQLIDYMINTLAANSKSARVKQLLLEKIDWTLSEDGTLNLDETQLSQMFKQVKDKLISFIQKDTNANVRDAAVALLGTFKAYLSANQIVADAINTLPKYRISEINKLAETKTVTLNKPPSSFSQERPQNQSRQQSERTEEVLDHYQSQPKEVSEKVKSKDAQSLSPPKNSYSTNESNVRQQDFQKERSPQIDQQDEEEEELQSSEQFIMPRSLGEQFCDTIDQNFEQGLHFLKSLAMIKHQQAIDLPSKNAVFMKLLSIVSNHCKNPIQQQQQAFSLKAMLWMKEELLGLEDCFNFTPQVMLAYSNTELQGRDSSVELYLLNSWVKQFRLRDLIDRVSQACTQKQEVFSIIFGWLMMHSLNGNPDEKWQIEDFRKLSVLLARHIHDTQVIEFFSMCIERFGMQKVRQFMEIQLMHSASEFNGFMKWLQRTYSDDGEEETKVERGVKLPEIVVDRVIDHRRVEHIESQHDVNESAVSSARGKQSANIHSKLYQELREKRKTSNQRKHNESEDGFNKYDQIINRLEAQLQKPATAVTAIQEEEVKLAKPVDKEKNFQFNKSSGSHFHQSEKSNRYQIVKTEEEDNDEDQEHSTVEQKPLGNQTKMDPSEFQQNVQDQLQQSTIKENLWKQELEKLEAEKKRIERERYELMQTKNKESSEWQQRFEEMRVEHEEVINNLREANKCYLTQVSENEDLKKQLQMMQDQNKLMMKKFEEFEKKLNQQEEQAILKKIQQQKQDQVTVVKQEHLALVEKVFKEVQVQSMRGEDEIGTKKIQDLLLNFDDKEETQRIGVSLFIHFQSLKTFDQKQRLVKALTLALDHEDVLFALPLETYKTLLDFNLKVFANEKAYLERNSIRASSHSMSRGNTYEQNEITQDVQKLVSKLLNSKEFTTSLVTLFQVLRQSMPEDLSIELTEEQKQYLRVVMRCISRITKALHSENPDLIRAFDVLIEMQKIFLKNPPENLREDLPCLQDFDYIYRGLKDVSDKLMELQPEKVISFLQFVKDQPQNAFIKYMNQIMAPKQQPQRTFEDEDEFYEDGY